MPSVLTRRRTLLGTAATALAAGSSTLLLSSDASACHNYVSPVDGRVGCGARKRDRKNDVSGDSGSTSTSTSTSTDSGTSTEQSSTSTGTGTQSDSGDPQISGSTIRVSSASQLANALGSAKAGNRIQLADGSYSGTFTITNSGTSSNPILIEAANLLGAVITSGLLIRGNHVIVSRVTFRSRDISVKAANCRVTRCLVESGAKISARGASSVEIDYNEVRGWGFKAIDVDPYHERRTGYGAHVHHNYCHSGTGHAIAVGQQVSHQTRPAAARIHHNLVENVKDGGVYLKSSNNLVYSNNLINGQSIACRFGRDNTFSDNWLENSVSLSVRDLNCVAKGNKLVGCRHGLVIHGGNQPSTTVKTSGIPPYPFAENCQLIDNDANRTAIGRTRSSYDPRLPAKGTLVGGHKGLIKYEYHSNTQMGSTSQSNSGGAARKLSRGEVGPRGRG